MKISNSKSIAPVFLSAFVLMLTGLASAEEAICRYCSDANALLPAGAELEGRYHYAPDRQVDVQHIKIDVTPDFDKRTIKATTSIKAQVIAKPVEILHLNAVNLHVKEVRCDGAIVEDFNSTRTALQIAFAEPVASGTEFTVHVDYSAEPVKGLYFRTPEMGYPKTDTHIWTQGETHEARHWFPCHIVCPLHQNYTQLQSNQQSTLLSISGKQKR